MVIASMIIVGIAIAYISGWNIWEKTAIQMQVRQAATLIINDMTRSIQRADSLSWSDKGLVVFFPAQDSIAKMDYRWGEGSLIRFADEDRQRLWPERDTDSVRVRDIAVEHDSTGYRLLIEIESLYSRFPEKIAIETHVFARNRALL